MPEYTSNDFFARNRENLDAIVSANVTAAKDAEQIAKHMLGMTSESFEGAWETARRLSSAKTISEAVEIQTKFARQALESFTENEMKLADLSMALMKDLTAPYTAPWMNGSSLPKPKKAS